MTYNMSYCRFQNTLGAMRECYEALEEGKHLSKDEHRAMKKLLELCETMTRDHADRTEEEYTDECEDEDQE